MKSQPASALSVDAVLPVPTLRAAAERAAGYAAQASAPATRRAYMADLTSWTTWCVRAGLEALPAQPAAVGTYLADQAEHLSVATIRRRLAAISTAHRQCGLHLDTRHPAIRDVMRGIQRQHGRAPRRARPATTAIVLALVATCDDCFIGRRDRALLLIGFAAALRRSELVGLDVTDIEFSPTGVLLHLRRSKTDQMGQGEVVGVLSTGSPTCPVAALRTWLDTGGISEGRAFRSVTRDGSKRLSMTGEAVALVVQRRAAMAGFDPAGFSGHSLRAGLATSAAAAGLAEADIGRQTRHRSVAVLRSYVRHGSVFLHNVSGAIGL